MSTNQLVTGSLLALILTGCGSSIEAKRNICGLTARGGINCDTEQLNLDVTIPGNLDATNTGHTLTYTDCDGDQVGSTVSGSRVAAGAGEWVSFGDSDIPDGAKQGTAKATPSV